MFTIIGGDGKEYGPATAAQVRSWIAAGRANLQTKAKALGTDEWRALGDFPEFAAPAVPPPMGGVAETTMVSPSGAALAGRGARLGARVIDWIIELICTVPGLLMIGPDFMRIVTAAMQGHEPDASELNLTRLGMGGLLLAGGWLLQLVVQVWLLSVRGQSIGKLLLRIRVVRLDDTKAGFVHAWLMREALVTLIGVVAGLLPFVGPILLRPGFHLTDWCFIFRDDQRCVHDLIAGTKVVQA